jgi:chromosome segregation protein
LEVSGFKSFVDPLEVRFAPGITGIVGPNGCGKSNLIDAITWALGEQSARLLRAQTMEDVIFNGSESRRPLGMAEVTLTFSVAPGHPAAEEGKIVISRRVFRSGESIYRLNGRTVRLKDIRDLLFDTGLGLRAYSILEQGKIGMILSGKPQERRSLLEEAAGITRYRVRREHAELKLTEASANLLRLDDILAEVERNLRSLRRQASAARRYEERRRELERLERSWLGFRLLILERELEAHDRTLQGLVDQEAETVARLTHQEAEVAKRREELQQSALRLVELERQIGKRSADLSSRREQIRAAERALQELEARQVQGEERAARRQSERKALGERLTQIEEELRTLEAQKREASARVADDGQIFAALEKEAQRAEEELHVQRDRLLHALGELDRARAQLHQAQLKRERAELGLQHLEGRLNSTRLEKDRLEAERAEAQARWKAAEVELAQSYEQLETLQQRLEIELQQEAELGQALRTAEASWAARSERRRGLLELEEEEREGGTALLERLSRLGLEGCRPLAPYLRSLPGWERALDFYLGRLEEAWILPEGHSLSSGVEKLARSPEAPQVVLLAPRPHPSASTPQLEDPDLVLPLGEALGLPPELSQALGPAFLVQNEPAAERLAAANPGTVFLAPSGAWFQGGVAHVAGTSTAPGHFTRRSELATLETQLSELESQLGQLREAIDRAVAARSATAKELHRIQEATNASRQQYAALEARVAELDNQLKRVSEQQAGLIHDLELQKTELERARREQAERLERLREFEERHLREVATLDEMQHQFEQLRQRRELARAQRAGQQGALDLIEERLRSRQAERNRCLAELERLREEDASWSQQLAQLAAERGQLELHLERFKGGVATLEQEVHLLTEQLATHGEVLAREQAALQNGENTLLAMRQQLDSLRAQILERRVALTGLERDRNHLREELTLRWGSSDLPEGVAEPPGTEELAAIGERCQKLRSDLEAMGPVNVLATEELAAEEVRFETLSAQRADVARSMESLRQTIQEINQASSERFRETFAQVNEQFHRTFVELFRGGEAAMRLLDEEDPLESAIEIVARPPGKRLQNLMLLSGGEKALTAIALLFALFRIRPSPFCILDEVDAPLDDLNTLRFVALLEQLAQETQVLVVTHNKLTMKACSRLFGVTMEERGVSKLVEVSLAEIFPEVELAPVAGG